MNNKGTIKKIIIGLGIAVVLLILYSMVTSSDTPATGNSSLSSIIGAGSFGQVQESNTALANAEILRILSNIQTISLNDDIFSNPVFRELHDSRFTIPRPTQIGRPNPFLPIGFDSVIIIPQVNQTEQTEQGFFDATDQSSPFPG